MVTNVSPSTVNRAVCYCDDCQAFPHHLGRADLPDAHGGTDIVQVAPPRLSFVQGQERMVGLCLTPRADAQRADELFGRPIGAIFSNYAVGPAPEGSTAF